MAGVSLQKPTAESSKNAENADEENRLILCSAKDKFVLTQDICVMCGAIGTDHEGCLIGCSQCGQCYHPYCINVKVTKVILQKGWRCLDCTVCESCGQRNDDASLILCDDCDISYHTYCLKPPLTFVPDGNWKCKWCASCQKCGINEPGTNCTWQNSYTECGPCASQSNCPVCAEGYADGELIIQCVTCDRWLHCSCDQIRNESEADRCSEDGYTCIMCRPTGAPPPHLRPKKKQLEKSSKPISSKNDEDSVPLALEGSHYVDGVYLSEHGLHQIKSLQAELSRQKAKRKPKNLPEPPVVDKDAGIMAAIESVVASSSLDNSFEDVKMEMMDPKDEAEIYKDGMPWPSSEPPPEGFTCVTNEQGASVLRKKRQRNLQKLGIGGFAVRNRNFRASGKDGNDEDGEDGDGKKKKTVRKKNKSKLSEMYPNYLQEAFFGKSLMADVPTVKLEIPSSDDEAKLTLTEDKMIKLSSEELKLVQAASKKKQEEDNESIEKTDELDIKKEEEDDNSDTEALKDVLGLPSEFVDNDLINHIMNDDELSKASGTLDDLTSEGGAPKDELAEMLQDPNFNIESLGTMDGNDVEEIFKGVLTDESQESQESVFAKSMNSYSRTSTPSHVSVAGSDLAMRSPAPQTSSQLLLQSPQHHAQGGIPSMMQQQQQPQTPQPQQQQNIPMHPMGVGGVNMGGVGPPPQQQSMMVAQQTMMTQPPTPQQQQQVQVQVQQQMMGNVPQSPINRGYYHTYHYRENFYQR